MNEIRHATKRDIEALKRVLDTIELFPSEMLDDMMHDYFENPASEDIWLTTIQDLKRNYTQEAIIRDFWKEGDDKVIFWKKLTE